MKWFGVLIVVMASSSPASASCYDVFGCSNQTYFRVRDLTSGPNCEFLYTMRNEIYQENGYCFKTARAIRTFGNSGCRYDNVGAVPLNRFERANAAAIAQAERQLGCPR